MSICQNCGVELDDSATHCPLCRAAIRPESVDQKESNYPDKSCAEDDEGLSSSERRKLFIELYSICSCIACFVVLAIEILIEKHIAWSLYPVASICYLYLIVCIPVILAGHPWLVYAVLGPSSLLFVFVIAVLSSGLSWFLPIALPIVVVIEGTVVACAALATRSKRKGINVIAIALAGVSIICAAIEITINLATANRLFISWSAVVCTACIPLSGLLLYLHYRIIKQASLKKLFRL